MIENLTPRGHFLLDLAFGVHHRGVVAAEGLPDAGQGQVCELAAEIHGDLPGEGHRAGLTGPAQLLDGGLEVLGRGRHDRGNADLGGAGVGDEISQHDLGQRLVDHRLVQRRERRHADQRTLELADVAIDAAGDEFEHVVRHIQAIHLRLLAQDRDAGLQLGRLNIGDQTPLEAGPQPVLQCRKLFRRAVRRDDDLFVRVVQRIEGMEELFLSAFLAFDELDVVDQQDVDVAEAAFERCGAVVTQRVDEVVGELLGRDVLDPHAREQLLRVVTGGVQQVGLAQS